MKRNWMMAYGMIGAFALSGMSMAQEATKNEEKKEEKKAEVTVKTTGKIIMAARMARSPRRPSAMVKSSKARRLMSK